MSAGQKVTLVLNESDADLIAWACDEMHLRGVPHLPEQTMRLAHLRDRLRFARRYRHGSERAPHIGSPIDQPDDASGVGHD